ncbi:MAG: alpha/beta hydrolase [Planctomycetota bacterium]
MSELLPAVELDPPGELRGSVIWLHGLGADGHDFEPILPLLPLGRLGVRVVLPHAPVMPVSINGGFVMPAWYDIRDGDLRQRHDEAGIRASAARITAWIEAEVARGVPARRIALVGFSQGGAMALHVGLRHPERLAGIGALSTYLLLEDQLEAERSATNRETPVFQAHGSYDPVVSLARGEGARDRLRRDGQPHEWRAYPMEHQVCEPELQALGDWFERVFA